MKIKKTMARFAAILLLLIMSISTIPVQAAVPELTGNNYIKTYPLSTGNNTAVYTSSSLNKRGTASPYKEYTATIYASDEIRIYALDFTYGWAYVAYPVSNGQYRYGYVKLGDITSYNAPQEAMKSTARITTYNRPGGSSYGTIFAGDLVYKLAESGSYTQVAYEIGSGNYKLAWIKTSSYNNYINVGHNPQGWVDVITIDNNKLFVRGWCFDRDRLSTGVVLHVYIGGPAGSQNAFAAYAISSDKYRPDVNNVYSVGDYHGFEETIELDTNRTGTCDVYIYAINIDGGTHNPLIGKGTVLLGSNEANNAAAQAVSSRLNELISTYKGTRWDGYYYGIQCKGFANLIFNKLFGVYIGAYDEATKYYLTNVNGATEVGRLTFDTMSLEAAKNLLLQGQPGDYIQVRRRGKSYGHSMILVGTSSTGITVFDCNSDGQNGVKVYDISWESFYSKNSAMSLYHANDYK